MKCSVNNCTNDTKTLCEGHGITFHNFPWFRNNWREVLGMDDEPTVNSLVCSDHFRSEDICVNKAGKRKIRNGAVPIKCRRVQVCRICLATDVKMFSIRDRGLLQAYVDVCGIIIEEDKLKDKLPDKLCWECAARLLAGSRLRNRAIKSHQLLTQLLLTTPCITLRGINTINRSENDLESNLSRHYNEPNDYDFYIKGNLKKPDSDNIIMEKEMESSEEDDFKQQYLEESNVVEEKNESDNDLINNDFEEEYLEVSIVEEKNDNDNDLINDDIEDEYLEESSVVEGNKGNDNDLIYDDIEDEFLEESSVVEGNNGNDNDLITECELNDSNVEEYEDDGNDERRVLNEESNISDDYEYDDDNINDSDENFEDKVSTVKKRKSNLKVKTPKMKLAKKDQKKISNTMDKSKPSQVNRSRPDLLDVSMFTITSLSLQEQLEDAQRRRDAPRNRNARYRCDVCGLGFAKINRYELHVARHGELAGKYQCFICARRQKTEKAMQRHLTSVHSRRYSCKQCPFVTHTRSMVHHHRERHIGARFQCPHCPCLFTNRSSYLGHLRYKHRADFICALCGYAFLSRRGVAIHKNMLHRFVDDKMPLEGPYCETCDVTFMSQEAHDTHLKVASQHSDKSDSNEIRNDPQSGSDKAAQMRERWSRNTRRRAATDKDRTSDNEELVTCEQCGKEFSGYRLYALHFRHNHPEKIRTQFSGKKDTVMCEQCGRLFQSTTSLKDHISTHTGKKLYQCNFCNRKFERKSEIAEHIKKTNHIGDFTFECGKCEKTFTERSMFLAHSKTHVRYDCHICGKEFIHLCNRKRHMWTHAALKPFKCEACDKTYANPSAQKSHFIHEHLKKPYPKRKKDLPPEKRRMRVEKRAPVED